MYYGKAAGRFFVSIPEELVRWKKGQKIAIGFNERDNLEISEAKWKQLLELHDFLGYQYLPTSRLKTKAIVVNRYPLLV